MNPKLYTRHRNIPVSEIKIPRSYRTTVPNKDKLHECAAFYMEHHIFDREIVLNHNGYLIDGYMAYIVAKSIGLETVKVLQVYPKERKVEIKLTWKQRITGRAIV